MSKPLILVMGATGTVGSEVVKQLAATGQRVRALVRDPKKAERFPKAVEVVHGGLALLVGDRHAGVGHQVLYDQLGRPFAQPALGLQDHPVSQHRVGHLLHVVRQGEVAAADRR